MIGSRQHSDYERVIVHELKRWQAKMQVPPSRLNRLSRATQQRINRFIPERIHQAITVTIKSMIKGILFGASYTTRKPVQDVSLEEREHKVRRRIGIYRKMAAAEGGVTGAGGFLMSFADFPAFLGIKMKMLYEIAALYGYDLDDYRERVYLLKIFQLAFSSQAQRNLVYGELSNWEKTCRELPEDLNEFDWRTFQLEYRDYLDLAKLAQMIPGIGAIVGITVNYRLTSHLGKTAMNAYRMRVLE